MPEEGIWGFNPTGEVITDAELDESGDDSSTPDPDFVSGEDVVRERDLEPEAKKEEPEEEEEEQLSLFDKVIAARQGEKATVVPDESERLRQENLELRNTVTELTRNVQDLMKVSLGSRVPETSAKNEDEEVINLNSPHVEEFLEKYGDDPKAILGLVNELVEQKVRHVGKTYETKLEEIDSERQTKAANAEEQAIFRQGAVLALQSGDDLDRQVLEDVFKRGEMSELSLYLRAHPEFKRSPQAFAAAVHEISAGIRRDSANLNIQPGESGSSTSASRMRSNSSQSRGSGNRGQRLINKNKPKEAEDPDDKYRQELLNLRKPTSILDRRDLGGLLS